MIVESPTKYTKAQRFNSTSEVNRDDVSYFGISYHPPLIGYSYMASSSTDPSVEINMGTHKVLSYLSGYRQNLSSEARTNALKILKYGYELNISPKIIQDLEDGGIFIDFISNSNYFAFELHHDGDIIMVKKIGDNKTEVSEIKTTNLNIDLFNQA